ncbi:MAG TPA: hypothetical protein VEJ18_05115, partial [Planctomycetota bacterium]|nr:hypothetical protein [Planctomycetota bacterium]
LYFAKDADMRARLVKKLADLQLKHGGWAHEYDNPFVTATVLHALIEAREAGADVPKTVVDRGAMALWMSRDRRGLFGYDFDRPGTTPEGGAGRMPFCEYVLHRAGRSSPDALKKALELSFKHHGLLERVRKYDDHADRHGNGGFFFWYDQLGRAWAARAANDSRAAALQREIVRSTQEIDGCWVDSHELGRVYGTAMALLTWRELGTR